ncbi:hypothetical protein J3R83DRAFT_5526 [Lanmaoa asiatica]|nr:hypothetical protein J3R83DRAFT_5526 [Lanmaoa asiatica]
MVEAFQDHDRVNCFKGATAALKAAVLEDGVDIRAYFLWIIESSETPTAHRADGYLTRFGVTYVDYATQKCYPKESAKFRTKVRTYASCPGCIPIDLLQWFGEDSGPKLSIKIPLAIQQRVTGNFDLEGPSMVNDLKA